MGATESPTRLLSYGEAFIGCPGDAETFMNRLTDVWTKLPVPGHRPRLMHWREHADILAHTGAQGTQYHIARTSDPATNPVFILIAHTIGTPVRPPTDGEGRRQWQDLRAWLNQHGWGMVAMIGDADFTDPANPPAGKVPLSGTLFELFDAMRTDPDHPDPGCNGPKTFLRVFDLAALVTPLTSAEADQTQMEQQRAWCDQVKAELKRSHTVLKPVTLAEFDRQAEAALRAAFDLPKLSPWHDTLPGLEAVTETMPLLFGRSEQIRNFTTDFFRDRPTLTLVEGVSGTGKSSFLRGGLMRDWYSPSPLGAGLRHRCRTLLVEPLLLQLEPEEDPLVSLGVLLTADPDAQKQHERVVGPLPSPVVPWAPELVSVSGDMAADLGVALDWWAELTRTADQPLILILDQAEQVEAIAHRAAQAEADRTGQDVEPNLSPAWWRFTALLAALIGRLNATGLSPALEGRAAELARQMPVHLILGLHRRSALTLWPLEAAALSQTAVTVEPLTNQRAWQEVIEGTCAAYGLAIEPALRDTMAAEAEYTVIKAPVLAAPAGADDSDHFAKSSVLPQVKVALQRILTQWVTDHPADQLHTHADTSLDPARYGTVAGISGSIDTLGETAWRVWQQKLAETRNLDLRGIFEQQQIQEQQDRDFGDLMAGLIDRSGKTVELAYMRDDSPRAQRRSELVAALRTHRLLTRIDGMYLRLPHRTMFKHWRRAQGWMISVEERLETKARLRARYQTGDEAKEWPERDLEPFAQLVLSWIGPRDDADSEVWDYVTSGLVARLDPKQMDWRANNALARMPFEVINAGLGDQPFVKNVINKLMAPPVMAQQVSQFLMSLAWVGLADQIDRLLAAVDAQAGQLVCRADPDTGFFPLLMAAQNGHEGCVTRLLAAGAKPDQVDDKTGLFPLLLTAQNGCQGCIELLLVAGAKPNQVDHKTGFFPLLIAAQNGHEGCVARLLAAGAKPGQVNDKTGTFPLQMAAQYGHEGCVARLLAVGTKPDQVDDRTGNFPLLIAVPGGHEGCVTRLLTAGAKPGQVNDKTGTFPLLIAAQYGHEGCVARLLAAGAKPGQVNNKTGNFPLLQAAQNGYESCVTRLLVAGAKPNQVNDKTGTFPLLMAAQDGHEGCVAQLLAAGAKPDYINPIDGSFPLLLAAQYGHEGCVMRLLAADANPNQVDPDDGFFPLLLAAQNGHEGCVTRLLLRGAKLNQIHDKTGTSPLLQAAQNGHKRCIELLLAAGAEPNQTNDESDILPLHLTVAMPSVLRQTAECDETSGELPRHMEALKNTSRDKQKLVETPLGIPAPWHKPALNDDVKANISKGLPALGIKYQNFLGIVSLQRALLSRISLYYCTFNMVHAEVPTILDAIWISWGTDRLTLPLAPGINLDGIIVSLRNADPLHNLHMREEQQIWAALALLCALPSRLPLAAGQLLPLSSTASLPDHPYPEWYWRSWHTRTGPEGPCVELPWIDGDRLVRGQVLVPLDGIGARILPRIETIAQGVKWQIPPWAMDAEGKPLPMRILGRIGEE